MSLPKRRAAIVGLGRHGLRHSQAYQMLDDVEVVAVCDALETQVTNALQQLPSARGYSDWKKLIEEEDLDVLSVVTNGPSHAEITIFASNHGVKRILCEKPMATSVKDALEMLEVCKANSTRLAIAHARRWVKGYQDLKQRMVDGVIGEPCYFSFTCGGGLFAGNGTHFMDLVRFLSEANPLTVVGWVSQTNNVNPRGAEFQDPGAFAVYHFEKNIRFVIDMSEDIGVTQRFEVIGSRGRIMIDEFDGRWEINARENKDPWWDPLHAEPFDPIPLDMVAMIAEGVKELLGDGEILCTGEDGLASLEMVIGAHVSHRNGNVPIALPLPQHFHGIDIPFT